MTGDAAVSCSSSVLPRVDACAALGVAQTASQKELRSAFRQRSLETHPDKGGATEDFLLIKAAFETLSKPQRLTSRERSPRRQPQQRRQPARRRQQSTKPPPRQLSPRAMARKLGFFPEMPAFVL